MNPETNHINTEFSKFPATPAGARALNVQYYYTARPCKNGHLGLRYASSGNCLDCHENKKLSLGKTFKAERSRNNVFRALKSLDAGETKYESENPCPRGHYIRFVSSNNCAECNAETMRVRAIDGYSRWRRIEKVYGLTKEMFESLRDKQDWECAICKDVLKEESKIHIDHNHKTGKVRGLLCNRCNQGIGLFRENQETLKQASEYLEKHNV